MQQVRGTATPWRRLGDGHMMIRRNALETDR